MSILLEKIQVSIVELKRLGFTDTFAAESALYNDLCAGGLTSQYKG